MKDIDQIAAALISRVLDEPYDADTREVPENPVAKIAEKAAFEHAGGPKNWDEPSTTSAFAKRARNLVEPQAYGVAAALAQHSVRTEDKAGADGSLWKYEYDSAGELLRVHQVTDDGGPLAKATVHKDGEVIERDLSKASSGRGRIRFEKTMITGEDGPEEWICGYDHTGECVRSMPLEDHEALHTYSEEALEI